MKNKILIIIALLLVVTGCGYKESVTQTRDLAYLKFTKSMFKSYTVTVNNKDTFNLGKCIQSASNEQCTNDTDDKLYEISSGNVYIKVVDENNQVVVNKSMYIGSGSSVEVTLP